MKYEHAWMEDALELELQLSMTSPRADFTLLSRH